MSDVISLLPDSVANQIAAGEVVQRPASVVKELLENAVDAGAKEIKLVVKDGGRTLIQVMDNGCGMSQTDARLSLERHATSKIKRSEDLFSIKTMGFRGEAIASIVAIAQCELKSRQAESEVGCRIVVEGSSVKKQEVCSCSTGTSITVKNLFFNVPARRKFLKSNAVENRHIIDQFERVALINPDIRFVYEQDGTEVFHLEPGNFRQRIVAIFGKKFNDRLVPLEEESSIVDLSGFVGKPEAAKKTRGEQYLFVNKRFIKSNYLHHAVLAAYEELLPNGFHPSYFIELTCDPGFIDINIHPTKTEIKFEDEKSIYAILRSTVKKALGVHNIAPSLDFNRETSFDDLEINRPIKEPMVSVDPSFNPFESKSAHVTKQTPSKAYLDGMERFFEKDRSLEQSSFGFGQSIETEEQPTGAKEEQTLSQRPFIAVQGAYIATSIKSGMMLIHRKRALSKVLFNRYTSSLAQGQRRCQQTLFPQTIEFSPQDVSLINELRPQLYQLGFDIEEFGPRTFILRGTPSGLEELVNKEFLEGLLEQYKNDQQHPQIELEQQLCWSLAQGQANVSKSQFPPEEVNELIDQLFACENPEVTPSGIPIVRTLSGEDIQKIFK